MSHDMNALGVSVRLCKGAYSEPPTVAYPDKIEVDRAYARQSRKLLSEGYRPALATHDPRLIRVPCAMPASGRSRPIAIPLKCSWASGAIFKSASLRPGID